MARSKIKRSKMKKYKKNELRVELKVKNVEEILLVKQSKVKIINIEIL